MDSETARLVKEALEECSRKIDGSISLVQGRCPEPEFQAYRKAAGRVMGYLFTDVLNPIYREHPELEPASLKDVGS